MAEINSKQQRAIELKYEGENYQAIAKTLRVSIDTIKNWFASNGVLFEKYHAYAKNMNRMRILEASITIAQQVHLASRMLISLMGSKRDEVKLKAAREILSYAFKDAGIGSADTTDNDLDVDKMSYEERLKLYEEWYGDKNKETKEYLEALEEAIRAAVPNYADNQSLQKTLGDVRRQALR